MTRNEARDRIIHDPGYYLKPDRQSQRGGNGKSPSYICPLCGSGSGKNGTGITSKDGVHFTCWAGCFQNADILDIIGMERKVEGYNAKLELACEAYGIDYDALDPEPGSGRELRWDDEITNRGKAKQGQKEPPVETGTAEAPTVAAQSGQTDYMAFYKECSQRRHESDYLLKRGISDEVQKSFLIGYCPNWQSPKALRDGKNPPATPRVIIPTSRHGYIARDTRPDEALSDRERKFCKMKEGEQQIFNRMALITATEPFFVVEGEIDCLSIIEAGYKGVGLGSVARVDHFIDVIKETRPAVPLLVALDNDKAGEEAAGKLLKGLQKLGVVCRAVNISGPYKDANERLINDREGLKAALADAIEGIKEAEDAERKKYLETGNDHFLQAFLNGIAAGADTPYTATGFKALDAVLDRGLYEGLYTIGAISSLGKTSMILQIADQIAEQGRDVLYFSLEMSRNELIAKSLSRLTAEIAKRDNLPLELAKTTRGITVSEFYRHYSAEERALIDRAVKEYREYAGHIRVFEGLGNYGVDHIRDAVKKHILFTGNRPVVFVDYLQILSPVNPKATDKMNTDAAVLELKRLSRDYKIPVICISSFNRDNYSAGVSMSAYKESGAIEYGSDVLIGLQLEGAGDKSFDVDKAKSENPRKVEAKVLKNRNGRTGDTVRFLYYPQYNLFYDVRETGKGSGRACKDKEPKLTRREKQRREIIAAIDGSRRDGRSLLVDVADALDISTRAVLNRMRDLGIRLTIEEGAITEWEVPDERDNPFEEGADLPV